jgi:RHS repeat-associated protein
MQAEYKYDVFGNRVEKTVDDDRVAPSSPVVMRFAIDGWNPAKPTPVGNENFDVFADLNGSNELLTRYMRGDEVDQLFGRVDKDDSTLSGYSYLTDHLGSIRDIIDNTGAVKDSLTNDAFGNATSETDASYRGRYAWTGREMDTETGLQYNRVRYYDSTTGRWISQDPVGFDAGDSNLYRYVTNQPLLKSDPSGLLGADIRELLEGKIVAIEKKYTLTNKEVAQLKIRLRQEKGTRLE